MFPLSHTFWSSSRHSLCTEMSWLEMNKYSVWGVFGEKNKEKTDFALFNKFNEKADVFYVEIWLESIHLKMIFLPLMEDGGV